MDDFELKLMKDNLRLKRQVAIQNNWIVWAMCGYILVWTSCWFYFN